MRILTWHIEFDSRNIQYEESMNVYNMLWTFIDTFDLKIPKHRMTCNDYHFKLGVF